MTNGIQSNYKNRQIGFGMSQFRNLEVFVEDSKITTKAAAAIDKYIKEEAPKDGKDILLSMAPAPQSFSENIVAYVKRKPVGLWQIAASLFTNGEHSSVKYDPSNPVGSIKRLVDDAVESLKRKQSRVEREAAKEIDINNKAKIFGSTGKCVETCLISHNRII